MSIQNWHVELFQYYNNEQVEFISTNLIILINVIGISIILNCGTNK